jgi:hypothetical protein
MVTKNSSKTYQVNVTGSKLQEFNKIMKRMPGVRATIMKTTNNPTKPRGRK